MRPGPAASLLPTAYRVAERRRETADAISFTTEPVGDQSLADFSPGQFDMLYAFGVGEIPISISGRSAHEGGRCYTIRSVGPVSQALSRINEGEILGARGPFGSGWPSWSSMDGARDLVVVAGGIGLAPLRTLVREAHAAAPPSGRVFVAYGARHPSEILYRDEIEQWAGRTGIDVSVTVDRAEAGWSHHVGFVTHLLRRHDFEPTRTIACVCGPEVMMTHTAHELLARGVSPDAIYLSVERNMHCADGTCGHCQLGPLYVCRDGPVFSYARIQRWMQIPEI